MGQSRVSTFLSTSPGPSADKYSRQLAVPGPIHGRGFAARVGVSRVVVPPKASPQIVSNGRVWIPLPATADSHGAISDPSAPTLDRLLSWFPHWSLKAKLLIWILWTWMGKKIRQRCGPGAFLASFGAEAVIQFARAVKTEVCVVFHSGGIVPSCRP